MIGMKSIAFLPFAKDSIRRNVIHIHRMMVPMITFKKSYLLSTGHRADRMRASPPIIELISTE
jgi:hypothetical protein